MAQECELLNNCGFFRKYGRSKDSALACQGFVSMYCRGSKMDECQRKIYRKKNGTSPPDEMMPNGKMMRS